MTCGSKICNACDFLHAMHIARVYGDKEEYLSNFNVPIQFFHSANVFKFPFFPSCCLNTREGRVGVKEEVEAGMCTWKKLNLIKNHVL